MNERELNALKGIQHDFMPGYNRKNHVMSGTSFPSIAATNQKYFREDLGYLCYYDSTQWVTVDLFIYQQSAQGLSATTTKRGRLPTDGNLIYVPGDVVATTYVDTTNDGTHNWTVLVSATGNVFGNDVQLHTFSTSADSPDVFVAHDDAADDTTPAKGAGVEILCTKNDTPGTLDVAVSFKYRLIIT